MFKVCAEMVSKFFKFAAFASAAKPPDTRQCISNLPLLDTEEMMELFRRHGFKDKKGNDLVDCDDFNKLLRYVGYLREKYVLEALKNSKEDEQP